VFSADNQFSVLLSVLRTGGGGGIVQMHHICSTKNPFNLRCESVTYSECTYYV